MGTLRSWEGTLTAERKVVSIGKDAANDVVVRDQAVSRRHCKLELHLKKGGVYVSDISTNGTYLNGRRLPKKEKRSKVLVAHGDELLLKSPEAGDPEFGYIVNLET